MESATRTLVVAGSSAVSIVGLVLSVVILPWVVVVLAVYGVWSIVV